MSQASSAKVLPRSRLSIFLKELPLAPSQSRLGASKAGRRVGDTSRVPVATTCTACADGPGSSRNTGTLPVLAHAAALSSAPVRSSARICQGFMPVGSRFLTLDALELLAFKWCRKLHTVTLRTFGQHGRDGRMQHDAIAHLLLHARKPPVARHAHFIEAGPRRIVS